MDTFLYAANFSSNQKCNWVNNITDVAKRCEFVLNTESCIYDGFIYDYTELAYCQLYISKWLASFVLVTISILLFLSIGILADDFLCPSLLTVSKTLRLPDNIAGVTLLALGNGAPDIFASASGIHHAMPHLIFSSLYGAGIFVTTVVTGSVLLIADFQMIKRPLIRDIAFYLGATSLVWFFIHTRELKLAYSIALICYYLVFIVTIVVSRFIYVRYGSKDQTVVSPTATTPRIQLNRENIVQVEEEFEAYGKPSRSNRSSIVTIRELSARTSSESSDASSSKEILDKRTQSMREDGVILTRFHRSGTLGSSRSRSQSSAHRYPHVAHHHWSNTLRSITKTNMEECYSRKSSAVSIMAKISERPEFVTQSSTRMEEFAGETKNFLLHICPVDILEWDSYTRCKKAKELIKTVPYFIMTVCIPVVDLESLNENWCRLLICLNLLLAPQVIIFIEQVDLNIDYIPLPFWLLVLIISLVLAAIVLVTSSAHQPPKYHRVFAFIGFGVSVAFIDALAGEVVELLKTFGIILNVSEAILGMTVLAWGNSLGDLISNLSMARHGYPGMAIAACFGGPMLNLLMGVGVPYFLEFLNYGPQHVVHFEYNNTLTLLYVTITASLVLSLVMFIVRRFKSSKIHGFLLIGIYLCYLVLALLMEFNVLPKYQRQHQRHESSLKHRHQFIPTGRPFHH